MRTVRRSLFFNWPARGTPTLHVAMLLSRKSIPLSLLICLRDLLFLSSQLKCPHGDRLRRTTAPASKAFFLNAVLIRVTYQKPCFMSRQRLPSYPPTASLRRARSRRGKIQLLLKFDILSHLSIVLCFFPLLILTLTFTWHVSQWSVSGFDCLICFYSTW